MCSAVDGTCLLLPLLLHFERLHNELLVEVLRADHAESLRGELAALAQLGSCLRPGAAVGGVERAAPAPGLAGHGAGHGRASEPRLGRRGPRRLLRTLPVDLLWASRRLQTVPH